MHEAKDNLPNDIEALQSLVLQLQQQNAQQSQFISQLLEQIKLSRHQHFGARSERFSLDQMALVFNEAEAAVAAEADEDTESATDPDSDKLTVSSYRRTRGGRRPLPPACRVSKSFMNWPMMRVRAIAARRRSTSLARSSASSWT